VQERLAHSRQAFYFGLLLMLAPGILSAMAGPGWGVALMAVMLAGAIVALAARLWYQRLLRTARHGGGSLRYPVALTGHARFTSHRETMI